jgi:hypothetical protein
LFKEVPMNDADKPVLPPEIQIDNENKELVDRIQAAMLHPLADTFHSCIDTLVRLARNVKGKARLWTDFSPLGFTFVIVKSDGSCWINGGLLFHGPHDGYGSGSAPTYAVSVGGAQGFQIHT